MSRRHQHIPFKPWYADNPPLLIDDAVIEYWGTQYDVHLVERYGIRFETFMADPEGYMEKILGGEYRPLLRWQQLIQAELDAEALKRTKAIDADDAEVDDRAKALEAIEAEFERGLEELPRRDGVIVEPLRHHSYKACGYRTEAGRKRA